MGARWVTRLGPRDLGSGAGCVGVGSLGRGRGQTMCSHQAGQLRRRLGETRKYQLGGAPLLGGMPIAPWEVAIVRAGIVLFVIMITTINAALIMSTAQFPS